MNPRRIDIFNGDADGICALIQLRLAEPADSLLITGVKRDIALLDRVEVRSGDRLTVLDISLDKNRDGLSQALECGAQVFYVDHHFPGDIPQHQNLQCLIDTAPEVCTSLLVNRYLRSQHPLWAVVGAFGDNLDAPAKTLAQSLQLDAGDVDALRELGGYINYNGYGATVADLHFRPEVLYRLLLDSATPLDFIRDNREAHTRLADGYRSDMAAAEAIQPWCSEAGSAAFLFPAEAWARRVSGVFGNRLVHRHPDRAHAILTVLPEGGYLVSVRAPLSRRSGADALVRKFPSGGGRSAAAGINCLPEDQLERFIGAFQGHWPVERATG